VEVDSVTPVVAEDVEQALAVGGGDLAQHQAFGAQDGRSGECRWRGPR
jgi:hypothetical protein